MRLKAPKIGIRTPAAANPAPVRARRKIVNTHDQLVAAGGGVAIVIASMETDPAHAWAVMRWEPGKGDMPTDEKAPWYQHKHRWFHFGHYADDRIHGRGAGRRLALQAAQGWVLRTYGEAGPWKRNALYDYVPTRINDKYPIDRGKDDKGDGSGL